MAESKKTEKHEKPVEVKSSSDKVKHCKISRMDLKQVEAALAKVEKEMGGLHSQYARMLVARMESLFQKVSFQPKMAAKDKTLKRAA